jgi:hypothetical protein
MPHTVDLWIKKGKKAKESGNLKLQLVHFADKNSHTQKVPQRHTIIDSELNVTSARPFKNLYEQYKEPEIDVAVFKIK